MRVEFFSRLAEIAGRDDRVVLLTGDLGFAVLEPFRERHPYRFVNVGVAEQNMIGMATGLAEAGFVPYCYSIATFALLRSYEFMRNGPVAHGFPVRVVGAGGGFDYGHNGLTHFALEDIAVACAQPSLTVVAPADGVQAAAALEAVHPLPGPAYVRLGRDSSPVPGLDGRFRLGHVERLSEGDDVAILALGPAAKIAVEARQTLADQGIDACVAVASSINPSPRHDLKRLAERFPAVVTVEAHYRHGGLGSMMANVIAENGLPCRLVQRCVETTPTGLTGSPSFLLEHVGLTSRAVAASAIEALSVARV